MSGNSADAALPSITEQPADQTVVASHPATFSVTASGTPPLRFQWEMNGSPIPGATLASYTMPAATTSENAAHFTVEVADSKGTIVSRAARLTVTPPGQISATPGNLSFGDVTVGSSATRVITVAASGSSDVTLSKVGVSGPGFDVSGASTGLVQTPGQATILQVTFSPVASGSVTGSISIMSDASTSVTTIYLSGSGVQAVSHSVSLSWTSSGSDIRGYNVYRSSTHGGPYAKLTPSMDGTTSYVDAEVQAGQIYYYVTTSVDSSNVESEYSNEVSAAIALT